METRRGEPTPPIALGAPPDDGPFHPGRFARPAVDVPERVVARLREVCASVDTTDGARDEAGRDWWPLALTWAVAGRVTARPGVIARPSSVAEVAAVLAVCNDGLVPVTAAAGRSGVCGASVPVFGGVALDLCGLAGITGVDDASLLVDVRAGTFGDVFEDALRAEHGLTLGHWPQSIALSTVGGWIACRGAGQYSTRYGKIEDMVVGLEVALADGRVLRTEGAGPRAATGPDLNRLFVGSEGTLGVITEARLRVHPVPAAERRAAYGFASFAAGLDACRRVLRRGATPAVLRLYDERESQRNFELDTNVLVVLDEGDPALIDGVMSVVADECTGATILDPGVVERWLGHRNDVSALPALVQRGIVLDTIEIAGRWSSLTPIYERATAALMDIGGMLSASAHQSHAYADGACLYFTWAARMPEGAAIGGPEAESVYNRAWDAVTEVTLAHGAALSHHHGVGLNRGRFMRAALGAGLDVLASVKASLDPNGILNPGKLGLPSRFGAVDWPAGELTGGSAGGS
jgi:alkyldihydroxyacetonephosphate synthase